jgi:hypothetical protein
MSTGTAVQMATGLNSSSNRLFIELKNGSVWMHRRTLSVSQSERMMLDITNDRRQVKLRNWTCVRKKC